MSKRAWKGRAYIGGLRAEGDTILIEKHGLDKDRSRRRTWKRRTYR